jgi:threonine aldolase
LAQDHASAQQIAQALEELPMVKEIMPVDTNIVIFKLGSEKTTQDFLTYLKEQQILASAFGKDKIRMVTHLDFTDAMLEKLIFVLQQMPELAMK